MEPLNNKANAQTNNTSSPDDSAGKTPNAGGWGDVQTPQPTKEQVIEARRQMRIESLTRGLMNEKVHPIQKKMIKNQIQLVQKHDFWDK